MSRYYYYGPFTDKETETERLANLPKVTQQNKYGLI